MVAGPETRESEAEEAETGEELDVGPGDHRALGTVAPDKHGKGEESRVGREDFGRVWGSFGGCGGQSYGVEDYTVVREAWGRGAAGAGAGGGVGFWAWGGGAFEESVFAVCGEQADYDGEQGAAGRCVA